MSLYRISELTEVSALNFDKDYLELSHADHPESKAYVSYKLPVQELAESLKSDIASRFGMQTELSISQPQLGRMFMNSACPFGLSCLSAQLLSGDWIPLAEVESKPLVLVSSDTYALSSQGTEVSVFRPDLSAFIDFAASSEFLSCNQEHTAVKVLASIFDSKHVLNQDNGLCQTISSSAPSLSGMFPTGNKILGLVDPDTMLSGCMQLAPDNVKIYTSDQDISIKTGIKYTVDASRCSSVYSKTLSSDSITPPSVKYVMCMFIKDFQTVVKVQTS